MSIVRAPRGKPQFVKIQNTTARDRKLSFRALGVLVHVLSMPDGWTATIDDLTEMAIEGRDAIRTAVTELERQGYVERRRTRDGAGRWVYDQVFHEVPVSGLPASDSQSTEPPAETQESPAQPSDWKPDVGQSGRREKTQGNGRPVEDPPLAATPPAPADGQLDLGSFARSKPKARAGKRAANADPANAAAIKVAQPIWDSKDPRPTSPFVALVQLVRGFLEAGWTDDEVTSAGKAAPVLTRNAMELQLRQARQPAKANGAGSDDAIRKFRNRNNRSKPAPKRGDFIDVKETSNGR